jgi:glycosyltransferase involved in cell wall biosynthesis
VPIVDGPVLSTHGGLLAALDDRRRLARIATEFDLIHVHSSHDHALAALLGRRPRLVRSIHHPRSARRRAFQRFAYRRTDAFTVVAEAHRRILLQSYPELDPARVAVVPGAVDLQRFRPDLDGHRFRRELGVPADAFLIGMVARFQAGRGQPLLVRAVARLVRALDGRRDPWLVLIGKGETQPEIESAIAQAALGPRTRLAGFRDADLPDAIRAADVTVLLREGNDASCRAVLESLACGVPVIGADHPAIRDALEPAAGGAPVGRLVPATDSEAEEALIGALLELALLPSPTRCAWSDAARARAVARYGDRARAEAVQTLYDSLPRSIPR